MNKYLSLQLLFLSLSLSVTQNAHADYIMTIGIQSQLADHVLSNCRVGSSLQSLPYPAPDKYSYNSNGKIVGDRNSFDKLPDSQYPVQMEFDTGDTNYNLFHDNFKYTVDNDDKYPAALTAIVQSGSTYDGSGLKYNNATVGMTLFSTLPANGANASTIYNKGEINMSFRMLGGQGQLECDIYDASGGLIGLIGFYTNDGGDGIPYSLAYGDDEESLTKNKHILSSMQFGNDDIPPHNYGGKYPKKRVVLRIYDANVQSDENEKLSIIQSPEANKKSIRKKNNATTTTLLTSSTQSATITNKTDDFVFKNCQKADRHGSWGSYPSPSDATLSGEHFTFTMNPKGNGIQGLINCEIHFQMPTKNTTTYQVARLVVEINNGGTVIGMFPYVNDPDVSDKLIKANYKYTLYAKNVGNYSFDIFQ